MPFHDSDSRTLCTRLLLDAQKKLPTCEVPLSQKDKDVLAQAPFQACLLHQRGKVTTNELYTFLTTSKDNSDISTSPLYRCPEVFFYLIVNKLLTPSTLMIIMHAGLNRNLSDLSETQRSIIPIILAYDADDILSDTTSELSHYIYAIRCLLHEENSRIFGPPYFIKNPMIDIGDNTVPHPLNIHLHVKTLKLTLLILSLVYTTVTLCYLFLIRPAFIQGFHEGEFALGFLAGLTGSLVWLGIAYNTFEATKCAKALNRVSINVSETYGTLFTPRVSNGPREATIIFNEPPLLPVRDPEYNRVPRIQ